MPSQKPTAPKHSKLEVVSTKWQRGLIITGPFSEIWKQKCHHSLCATCKSYGPMPYHGFQHDKCRYYTSKTRKWLGYSTTWLRVICEAWRIQLWCFSWSFLVRYFSAQAERSVISGEFWKTTDRLSDRSALFPTRTIMTSFPRSARTSSIHLDVERKEARSFLELAILPKRRRDNKNLLVISNTTIATEESRMYDGINDRNRSYGATTLSCLFVSNG